jgi:peptidoglycan/xylan/chitin deacetylase (PgdA/CDA1 family)
VRHHLDRTGDVVALTFDDGPDPDHTPAILDELARLGVVATFFLVGRRASTHPDIVRRILDEGHAVGSHSDSHPEPWRVSLRPLVLEYRRGRVHVEQAARRPVPLFRPPKGHVNVSGAVAMRAARVQPWLWTIDPGDWRPAVRADEIVAGLAGLRAGDVILLHDAIDGPLAPSALDRTATRAALPGIVGLARERHLRFGTLG